MTIKPSTDLSTKIAKYSNSNMDFIRYNQVVRE